MPGRLEQLVKRVYHHWRLTQEVQGPRAHPDEESLASFCQRQLPADEEKQLREHLLSCSRCSEAVAVTLRLNQQPAQDITVPPALASRMSAFIQELPAQLLEIVVALKEAALELLETTGQVRLGNELLPAALLRSRKAHEFKDEVVILREFPDLAVEIRIEQKGTQAFSAHLTITDTVTGAARKDVRVSLFRDSTELESYQSQTGRVSFAHVAAGKYTVELSRQEQRLASILLDIRA